MIDRRFRSLAVTTLPLLVLAAACGPSAPPAPPPATPPPPAATPTPRKPLSPKEYEALTPAERQAAQQGSLGRFKVFYDFRFADIQPESGITFQHHFVDDAGRDYKLTHYDHGTGMSAADVDGDGLPDLLFLTQLGRNELWKNLGKGRFRDVTREAGLDSADLVSSGAAFGDIDNDGDPDLFVTTIRHGNRLYRNDGKGRFQDVSKEAGVDYSGHSAGALFLDFDHDGRLDLFVCNIGKFTTDIQGRGGYWVGRQNAFEGHLDPTLSEPALLYRNVDGKRFEEVAGAMGIRDTGWSGDAAAVDFNADGWTDLYLANMQGDDRYFVNDGGKGFVDRTKESFPKTSWGATGLTTLDFDNDGRFDLFTVDMHSDMFGPILKTAEKLKSDVDPGWFMLQGGMDNTFGNSFYRNIDGTHFEEISDRIGVETYWPWGTSAGDFNADGFEDLFVANSMSYPWRYQPNSLLLNNAGEGFLDAEYLVGIEPRRDGKTETKWFELDCDGEDRTHAECAARTGRITVNGTLGTRASLVADLDGDGDLDLATNEMGASPQILINDLTERKKVSYLEVALVGTTSNRDGIGARVKVTAGPASWTKMRHGSAGFYSHSLLPLYFGLGEAARADRVEVTWPSGRTQVVTDGIPANGRLTVTEPKE